MEPWGTPKGAIFQSDGVTVIEFLLFNWSFWYLFCKYELSKLKKIPLTP
jgi:hypothetical protein